MKDTNKQIELDRTAYKLAEKYPEEVDNFPKEKLQKYIHPEYFEPKDLATIYRRILESAQNRNMWPNVIGKAIGGVDKLSSLLCGFQPSKVLDKYDDDLKRVLGDIVSQLKPSGQIRQDPRSSWPQFCKTIVSGAAFMAQFDTARDFCEFVDFFDRDDRTRPSLPMLLSHEIDGFGFPLACDFLKEIGYLKFGKPDVHVKKIFFELGLTKSKDDYKVFKAIQRVAKNVDATPFKVDKVFWLAGSGYYLKEQGKKVRGDKHRKDFIDYVKNRLIK
jgi:hypothetical protein